MKNIYLALDEEIVSAVDKLTQAEASRINLMVPQDAQIWQSSINLKLLKREADNLNKEITFVVSNALNAEMAQRIGFSVKMVKKESELSPVELIEEKEIKTEEPEAELAKENPDEQLKDKDMLDYLVEELKPEKSTKTIPFLKRKGKKKYSFLAVFRPKNIQKSMSDVVSPSPRVEPKVNLFTAHKQKSTKEQVDVEPPTEKAVDVSFQSLASKWPKLLLGLAGLSLIIAFIVAYLVLPTTQIVISPKAEKISLDLKITGSLDISEIDEVLNKIPLEELELTKTESREFLASGEEQLEDKAEGRITIYNEYSSSPQTLVATTRFESLNGKIFRILENITVPGAEIVENKIVPNTMEIKVVADQPGADYNIEATDFTIPGFEGTPKFSGFYAKSETSMTGGSIEKVKVITAKDIQEAEEKLSQDSKEQIYSSFNEQIPTDLKLIEDSLKEEIITLSTAEEGMQAEKFIIEKKVTIKGMLFREDDLKQIVVANVISQVSTDRVLALGTQQIKWLDIEIHQEEILFSLYAEQETVSFIDVEELKENLAGKSETEVRKYLTERSEIEEVEVSFWPFWVKRIPKQKERIKVIIDST